MAKSKKMIKIPDNEISRELLDVLNKMNPSGPQIELDEFEDVCNQVIESMDEVEAAKYSALNFLMENGITPEDYASYYESYKMTENLRDKMAVDYHEELPFNLYRHKTVVEEYPPLENSEEYTLVLKIQLKDVTKPPMWREVEVPANLNYYDLHDVIQIVNGFYDCHLWRFNQKAYDQSLVIGLEDDGSDSMCLEEVTHEAEKTPLTIFLQKKGDKLEYTYDFGDDWIFTVEVRDVIKKKQDYPICRRYKGELNPVEDMGGVWSYMEMRNDLEAWNMMTKAQRRKQAKMRCFDSPEEYFDHITDHLINLEEVNAELRDNFL